MDEPRPWIPDWIKAVTGLLLVLWVVLNVAYRLGAGGISVYGADTDLHREYDSSLFAVDEAKAIAFELDERGDVALVRYKPGLIPFRPVCGMNELDGRVLPGLVYKQDRWLYTEFPEMEGPDVYDLRTGELQTFDPPRPAKGRVDPASIPFYAEHGLVFDEAHRVDPFWVAENHESLSHINESCLTFNAAFFLLFMLMLVFTVFAVIGALLRRRKA